MCDRSDGKNRQRRTSESLVTEAFTDQELGNGERLQDHALKQLTPDTIEKLRKGVPFVLFDGKVSLPGFKTLKRTPTAHVRIAAIKNKLSTGRPAKTTGPSVEKSLTENPSAPLDFVVTVDTDQRLSDDDVLSSFAHEVTHISQILSGALKAGAEKETEEHIQTQTEQEAVLSAVVSLVTMERYSAAARHAIDRGPYFVKMLETTDKQELLETVFSRKGMTKEKLSMFEEALFSLFAETMHEAAASAIEKGKKMSAEEATVKILNSLTRKGIFSFFRAVCSVFGVDKTFDDMKSTIYVPFLKKVMNGEGIND